LCALCPRRSVENDRFKEEIETMTGRRLKSKTEDGLWDGEKGRINLFLTIVDAYI